MSHVQIVYVMGTPEPPTNSHHCPSFNRTYFYHWYYYVVNRAAKFPNILIDINEVISCYKQNALRICSFQSRSSLIAKQSCVSHQTTRYSILSVETCQRYYSSIRVAMLCAYFST